jgi:hypothetical protein
MHAHAFEAGVRISGGSADFVSFVDIRSICLRRQENLGPATV